MGVRNFELYFIHSKIFQIFFLSSDSKYFPWVHQVFRIKCQFYVPFNQRRVRWIVDLRHTNNRIIVFVLLILRSIILFLNTLFIRGLLFSLCNILSSFQFSYFLFHMLCMLQRLSILFPFH